jgi:hypothetical protein
MSKRKGSTDTTPHGGSRLGPLASLCERVKSAKVVPRCSTSLASYHAAKENGTIAPRDTRDGWGLLSLPLYRKRRFDAGARSLRTARGRLAYRCRFLPVGAGLMPNTSIISRARTMCVGPWDIRVSTPRRSPDTR